MDSYDRLLWQILAYALLCTAFAVWQISLHLLGGR